MQQSRAPRRLFDDIVAQLQSRQTEQAIASCRALLARYPDDINILGLLGAALGDARRFDEAEKILHKVIDLAPTFAKPYEDLGTLLMQQHKAQEALPLLEKAVRLDPQLEEAHFQLGKALAQLGRGRDADASFERCFALSPVRRMMALAAEHHKAGRLQDAEQLCRKVLQNNPRHVDALRMLGLIAAASGDLDDAEHLLRQALASAPDHTPAMFELGRVLKELERPEDAIEVYRELLALQPDNPKAHYRLAGASGAGGAERGSRRCLPPLPGTGTQTRGGLAGSGAYAQNPRGPGGRYRRLSALPRAGAGLRRGVLQSGQPQDLPF